MSTDTFICQHGRTVAQTPLPECETDVRALLNVAKTGTGDERADALNRLVDGPLCVAFSTIHEVAEALVGRPVWTHEFARGQFEHLVAETRSQEHPTDLEAHVVGSLDQLMGGKPVHVVRPSDLGGPS